MSTFVRRKQGNGEVSLAAQVGRKDPFKQTNKKTRRKEKERKRNERIESINNKKSHLECFFH